MKIILIYLCVFHVFSAAEKPLELESLNESDNLLSRVEQYNYRLPNNSRPELYEIELRTNIDRNEFDFSGVVRVEITILEDSNRITLHARQLTVTHIELEEDGGQKISTEPYLYDIVREFLTITTDGVVLEKDKKYILTIEYNGELRTDLGGFYRSSYKDPSGSKRFKVIPFSFFFPY